MRDLLSQTAREASEGLPLEVYSRTGWRRGVIGIEWWLLLSFVLGSVAGGFLSEAGKDTWSAIKKIVLAALGRRPTSSPIQAEIVMVRGEMTLVVSSQINSEEDLRKLLDEAQQIFGDFSARPSQFLPPSSQSSIKIDVSKGQDRVHQIRSESEKLTE